MVGLTTPVNERRLLGDDAMTDDSDDSLTLRVAKAIPSDVGHGRARVPFDNDLNPSLAILLRYQERGRPQP